MGFRERERLSKKDEVFLVMKRVFSKEGERLKVGFKFNSIVVDLGQEH